SFLKLPDDLLDGVNRIAYLVCLSLYFLQIDVFRKLQQSFEQFRLFFRLFSALFCFGCFFIRIPKRIVFSKQYPFFILLLPRPSFVTNHFDQYWVFVQKGFIFSNSWISFFSSKCSHTSN